MYVTQLKKNGVAWELADDFVGDLDAVLADTGEVIKKTPTKLVTRHTLGNRTVYLKRYINRVGLRPLKYFFKISEARNEWALAAEVTARGIPVVRYLAVGERWTTLGLQESLIISEGFDGARLDKYPRHQNDDLQTALAGLLRLMHDRGVLQRDLHHNILVRENPLELRRIDVDRGEMREPLEEAQRVENLAYINCFVPLREKFFTSYQAAPGFIAKILRRSDAILRELAVRRAHRCLEHNLRFEPKRIGDLTWWVRLEFFGEACKRLLENPDAALESCSRLFKSGHNRQSTIGAFDGVVLKRFNQKNRWNYLKDLFRPSRAFRAYQKAYHLELLGIPTPRPVAAAERRCCRVVLNSYLVTEEIRDANDLRFIAQLDMSIVRRAGTLIGRLHHCGFSHRDLKETNIVADASGKVWLLDLDGLVEVGETTYNRAAADLARLTRAAAKYPSVTRAHRLTFLRAYCQARGIEKIPRL